MAESPQELFEKKFVVATNGCHIWTASRKRSAKSEEYGQFWFKGTMALAHRAAFELYIGPIPDGMCVCHRCDQPLCVNPSHLFLGTHQDNSDDKMRKGRDRKARGEESPRTRLTSGQVAEIRAKHAAGTSHRALAREYGYSKSGIGHITRGTTWATGHG